MAISNTKLKLSGFNNLTKTFSFNIYDICYAETPEQRRQYIAYIDEAYNAERLRRILNQVSDIIGAVVLNIAHQDYDPQGASATALIAEEPILSANPTALRDSAPRRDAVVAHLDKSHISVHTYPESHPDNGISTFRADIDVATCGKVSPLKALNFLIQSFDSDIVTMDYRVRGFTRDIHGRKHFMDHSITSIQDFIDAGTQRRYQMLDVNLCAENIFHTKMMLREFDLDNYLFAIEAKDLPERDQRTIRAQLRREMEEIFYGRNVTPGCKV